MNPSNALALALGWLLLASHPVSSQPPSAPQVTVRPERPVQGTLFVVRVEDPERRLDGVDGRAGGEPLRFWRTEGGAFESLAPAPIDASSTLSVTLTLRYGHGGVENVTVPVPIAEGSFQHERLTVAPRFGGRLSAADQARLDRDRQRAAAVSAAAGATPRLWSDDVRLPRRDRVTSGFGNGRVFNGQVSGRHMGLDLDGEPGDTVVAAARGVVAVVDDFLLAGRIVYLNHGGGLLSGYFHLSEQLVAEGDTVQAGTPIGRVGATGRVTGPHLHWVVRFGSTSVDPRSLIDVVAGGR